MMLFVVESNNYQTEVVCAQINMVHLALHWLIARYSSDSLEITPKLISKRDQLLAQFFVFLLFYNWKFFLPNIDQILQLCQDNFTL